MKNTTQLSVSEIEKIFTRYQTIQTTCENGESKEFIINGIYQSSNTGYILSGHRHYTIEKSKYGQMFLIFGTEKYLISENIVSDCPTIIITAKKGHSIDVDSSSLEVIFQKGDVIKTISGHINMRTNWVHLYDEKVEIELNDWGVDLDDIGLQIENRSIPLNH